jgi:hypothetical protein
MDLNLQSDKKWQMTTLYAGKSKGVSPMLIERCSAKSCVVMNPTNEIKVVKELSKRKGKHSQGKYARYACPAEGLLTSAADKKLKAGWKWLYDTAGLLRGDELQSQIS